MFKALVVTVLLGALAVGCSSEADDVAVADASHDLACSSIEVLDTDTEGSSLERFRLYGCGHEVVYSCELKEVRTRREWTCSRSNYRFPV